MRKIVCTGGAGFIGSNYIHFMLKNHDDVKIICLDDLTYAGNMENLQDVFLNDRFSFVKGSITDKSLVSDLFEKERPSHVVNFAAESHVDNSIKNPELFTETNVLGTSVLLNASLKYGIKRFHQVSTDEVYGSLPLGRPDLLFSEDMPLTPSSPYSATKAAADLLSLSYFKTFGLDLTISRCGNNYGPYQFPEKLIPLIIVNAVKNKPIPVYGDGKNVRDWLYVTDHVRAIDLITEKGVSGAVYNVGANNEKSNIDIVKKILNIIGKSEDLISFVEDRKAHDKRYGINAVKIKNELSWESIFDFDSAIEETVSWYIKNREWWENILSGEYRKYSESVDV